MCEGRTALNFAVTHGHDVVEAFQNRTAQQHLKSRLWKYNTSDVSWFVEEEMP